MASAETREITLRVTPEQAGYLQRLADMTGVKIEEAAAWGAAMFIRNPYARSQFIGDFRKIKDVAQ